MSRLPRLLALETATECCSVALLNAGEITTRTVHSKNQHAAQILRLIDELLQHADLELSAIDALVLGCGPGSFTGIRIAMSITQGLAYGAHKPVIPIPTLQIMAQQAYQQYGVKHALVALDARMQQIYAGLYHLGTQGLMQPYSALMLSDVENFLVDAQTCIQDQDSTVSEWQGVGNAWQVYDESLQAIHNPFYPAQVYPDIEPLASAALMLAINAYRDGVMLPIEQVIPIYLRDDVAKKMSDPRR